MRSVFERILLPVDEAEDMAALVDTVAAMARAFNSQVTVLHLRERVISAGGDRARETPRESAGFGQSIADELERRGVRARIAIDSARPDNVGPQILKHAEDLDASLILIGGHHVHNVRERLLGDLGRVLAHGARCPLLLLPSGHR